jgi:hypothetical protein
MPSLHEIQRRMAEALFDGADAPAAVLLREDGIDATERIGIYRNNLREGFRKALALEFPVIEKLVGEHYFRALAQAFLAANPSRNGDLHHIGAPFPGFLAERFQGTEYEYLADVASLEWAHCEVLVAEDRPALETASLGHIAAELYSQLRFEFSPACRLLQSRYPVVRIWLANQPGAQEEGLIDLSGGGDSLLVRRGPAEVEFHALEAPRYAFARALAQGNTLESAFDEAQRSDPDFDLASALQWLVHHGVLTSAAVQ